MPRRPWLRIHRWIALSVGFVVAVLGVSGSAMVLRGPILRWEVGADAVRLHQTPAPGTSYASQEAWKSAAREAYPQLERIMGVASPRTGFLISDNALVFGAVRGRQAMGIAMIDPYTAQARAFFVYDDLILAKVVALHRSLFLPRPVAGAMLAACGIALLISLVTGAWLWWPRGSGGGSWRRALTMSRRSRGMRRWAELHGVVAAYSFLPLMFLALTGIWLAEREWFSWMGLGKSFKPIASGVHTGLVLGLPGEIAAFLAGLALPILYISGLILWWRRRPRRGVGRAPWKGI